MNKTTIIYIISVVSLLFFLKKISKIDTQDICYPFGSDMQKNKKYFGNITFLSDKNGVNTFWGKPKLKDTPKEIIDKIQWLAKGHERDTIWRKCFITSIIMSIILSIVHGIHDIKFLLTTLFVCILGVYGKHVYMNRHLYWRRARFIDIHVKKLKDIFNISQDNCVYLNKLI